MTTPQQPLVRGSEIDLEVTDLAFGGRGVARHNGLVVFVTGALPGEAVRARIDRVRRGYAEATTLELARPSADRTTPACRHYADCGGCVLQHQKREAQALWKGRQVRAAVERIARIPDPPVSDTVLAGDPWEYRFRIDFDWSSDRRGHTILGLHHREDPAAIVPIDRCELIAASLRPIAAWFAAAAAAHRLQPWDRRRRRGLLRRLGLQHGTGTGEILVSLETSRGTPPQLAALASETIRRFPRVVGVVRREFDRGDEFVEDSILAGRDHLYVEIDEDRLMVPAQVFFQPNREGSAVLRERVMAAVGPASGQSILELFCGVGFLTLGLARRASTVVGVEGSRAACAAARQNIALSRLGNCQVVHREVGAALPDLLPDRWDTIVLDPPRVGLASASARAIARATVNRVVYVSCDPATLARDLRILCEAGNYRLKSIEPIDLFPQTQHIESIAVLVAPAGPAGGTPGPG